MSHTADPLLSQGPTTDRNGREGTPPKKWASTLNSGMAPPPPRGSAFLPTTTKPMGNLPSALSPAVTTLPLTTTTMSGNHSSSHAASPSVPPPPPSWVHSTTTVPSAAFSSSSSSLHPGATPVPRGSPHVPQHISMGSVVAGVPQQRHVAISSSLSSSASASQPPSLLSMADSTTQGHHHHHHLAVAGGSGVVSAVNLLPLRQPNIATSQVSSSSAFPWLNATSTTTAASYGTTVATSTHSRTNTPILRIVWQRLSVLVTLLLLQSASQLVLELYEDMIAANVVIPLFLTMLIGAGGNAGNQAAVYAISGLVSGELKASHFRSLFRREMAVGLLSSSCLFLIGLVRVYWYYVQEDVQPTPIFTTVFAISLSLFLIVLLSVGLGCALPFFLLRLRVNVEHAAPVIQVLMDILGVVITCVTCSFFFPRSARIPNPSA